MKKNEGRPHFSILPRLQSDNCKKLGQYFLGIFCYWKNEK